MQYPIQVSQSKINVRISDMIIEKLYYCIYDNKIFLFYRDQNLFLNCFEIVETDLVNKVKKIDGKNLDMILQKYAQNKLNIK